MESMMKRLLLVVLGFCLISGAAWAGSYTYTPNPANMYNLPHPYCFSWTIDLASMGFDHRGSHFLRRDHFPSDQ